METGRASATPRRRWSTARESNESGNNKKWTWANFWNHQVTYDLQGDLGIIMVIQTKANDGNKIHSVSLYDGRTFSTDNFNARPGI
jgi:hypothetical protein